MVKNDICLGGASKQNAFFEKSAPKNAHMPLMSRIGPEMYPYFLLNYL